MNPIAIIAGLIALLLLALALLLLRRGNRPEPRPASDLRFRPSPETKARVLEMFHEHCRRSEEGGNDAS